MKRKTIILFDILLFLLCFLCESNIEVTFGEVVEIQEYSHHVAIHEEDTHGKVSYPYRCGGTLLNERVVLTAAHCLVDIYSDENSFSKSKFLVFAGWSKIWKGRFDDGADISNLFKEEKNDGRKIVEVENFYFYKKNWTENFDDIVLFSLKEPIRESKYIKYALVDHNIYNNNYNVDHTEKITTNTPYFQGFGYPDAASFSAGRIGGDLRMIRMPIQPFEKCNITSPSLKNITTKPDKRMIGVGRVSEINLLCVGDGFAETCSGDSGGGLVIKKKKDITTTKTSYFSRKNIIRRWWVIGISSFHPYFDLSNDPELSDLAEENNDYYCGRGYAGFVRVSYYSDWIDRTSNQILKDYHRRTYEKLHFLCSIIFVFFAAVLCIFSIFFIPVTTTRIIRKKQRQEVNV